MRNQCVEGSRIYFVFNHNSKLLAIGVNVIKGLLKGLRRSGVLYYLKEAINSLLLV